MLTQNETQAASLKALKIAREAFVDAGCEVSAPGQSASGEFYIALNGVDVAVKIEVL